jgi:hypothetical protein
VGAGHGVEQPRRRYSSFIRTHIFFARLRALGGEHMQCGEEPRVDDASKKIAVLLAAAYKQRTRIRLVQTTPEPLQVNSGP